LFSQPWFQRPKKSGLNSPFIKILAPKSFVRLLLFEQLFPAFLLPGMAYSIAFAKPAKSSAFTIFAEAMQDSRKTRILTKTSIFTNSFPVPVFLFQNSHSLKQRPINRPAS